MLSGHVAYYDGVSSDDMLHARLSQSKDQPLVLQDLQQLSDVRQPLHTLTLASG
jgi:tRNA U34 2-thiouridine synthase MnmA/TrmU